MLTPDIMPTNKNAAKTKEKPIINKMGGACQSLGQALLMTTGSNAVEEKVSEFSA
ncbi:hypothetical protein ACE1TI_03640 [Alteribacillus sp. JSM 102045]|uniref:hypothetical protein n=1 Tax=Alteribacillus sp. JSM 102045 TaxID=1562101 RepID=UPI0035BF6020